MRRKLLALAAVLALLLTVTACGGDGGGEDGRLKIIAANFPGYDLTRAVTGDLAEVQLLLPPGAESHSYEPTPRDILAVQNCDLFVYLGGDAEVLEDYHGNNLLVYSSYWAIDFINRRNPGLEVSEIVVEEG